MARSLAHHNQSVPHYLRRYSFQSTGLFDARKETDGVFDDVDMELDDAEQLTEVTDDEDEEAEQNEPTDQHEFEENRRPMAQHDLEEQCTGRSFSVLVI